jgi:hypothetical protein
MLYFLLLVAVVVIVWNVRNNSKLKAEIAKLKSEAQAVVGQTIVNEVKKVL